MGLIDFGIMADERDLSDFDSREIFSGFFGMFSAHHLRDKEANLLEFILTDDDCQEVVFLKATYVKRYGKEPAVGMRASSWEIVAHFAAAGLGIGYFPDYIAKSKQERLRPYKNNLPPFPYRICAIYPRGIRLRGSSKAFLKYFHKYY